jgi:hypothetical protein
MLCCGGLAVVLVGLVALVMWSRSRAATDDRARQSREDFYASRQRFVGVGCKRTVGAVGEYFSRYLGGIVAERMNGGEAIAVLEPEPDNPKDPEAVQVIIFGHEVGYLSASHARQYRPAIDLAGQHGELLAVRVQCRSYKTQIEGEPGEMNEFLLFLPTMVSLTRELEAAYSA